MDTSIAAAVDRLDSKSGTEIEAAWIALRPHGLMLTPYFRQAYSRFKNSTGRTTLVFYATAYARVSDDAFYLGCSALHDRSKVVRDRACGLLAYSLRAEAISYLRPILTDADVSVRQSSTAAIAAIRARETIISSSTEREAGRPGGLLIQRIVKGSELSK